MDVKGLKSITPESCYEQSSVRQASSSGGIEPLLRERNQKRNEMTRLCQTGMIDHCEFDGHGLLALFMSGFQLHGRSERTADSVP